MPRPALKFLFTQSIIFSPQSSKIEVSSAVVVQPLSQMRQLGWTYQAEKAAVTDVQ